MTRVKFTILANGATLAEAKAMAERTDAHMNSKCSEKVSDRNSRWPHSYPCEKRSKVERDGKAYCTIHDPEYIKAKDAVRNAKWKADDIAQQRLSDIKQMEREVCKFALASLKAGLALPDDLRVVVQKLSGLMS